MSFDLCFWAGGRTPLSRAQAKAIGGIVMTNGTHPLLSESPKLVAFQRRVRQLVAAGGTVVPVEISASKTAIVLSLPWEHAQSAADQIAGLAREFNLIVFDPQSGDCWDPATDDSLVGEPLSESNWKERMASSLRELRAAGFEIESPTPWADAWEGDAAGEDSTDASPFKEDAAAEVARIAESTASSDPATRVRAAVTLGAKGGHRSAIAALRRLLGDADLRVQSAAASSLGATGDAASFGEVLLLTRFLTERAAAGGDEDLQVAVASAATGLARLAIKRGKSEQKEALDVVHAARAAMSIPDLRSAIDDALHDGWADDSTS